MAPNSSETFNHADRQRRDTGADLNRAGDAIQSAINDAWSAGGSYVMGALRAGGEFRDRTIQGTERNLASAGHAVAGIADDLSDLGRPFVNAANATRDAVVDASNYVAEQAVGGAHAVLQAGRDGTHAVLQAGIDGVSAVQTFEHDRTAAFDRTRPHLAAADRLGGNHDTILNHLDGLLLGGNSEHEPHPAAPQRTAHDAPAAPASHDAPAAPHTASEAAAAHPTTAHDAPAAAPRAADATHHRVRSGESYWSIAAEQGGTRGQILARSNRLQELNHHENLLPGLEIVGS